MWPASAHALHDELQEALAAFTGERRPARRRAGQPAPRVADPAGGFGVAIIEAASTAALDAMQRADPVIAAGRGFAYKNLLMLAIAVRPSLPLAPITSVTP